MKKLTQLSLLSLSLFGSAAALACASCGCSLNTDYASQGMGNAPGWTVDLRYDYLNQNQLRSGTGTISPSAAAATPTASGFAEVEGFTANRYITASADYNNGDQWGVTISVPYIIRDHMTFGQSDDGVTIDPANGYTSHASGVGDIKVTARYFGWAQERDWGIQFGLKLPTGNNAQTALMNGSTTLTAVDPGLQLGTGTTDLIVGAYKFGHLEGTDNWGYFTSFQYQSALNSSNAPSAIVNVSGTGGDYRPGNSLTVNAGFNYHGFAQWTPTLQFNYINKQTDSGSMADTFSTGGTLLYVTPGAVYRVNDQASLYTNVQVPLYQNLDGIQLAPKYIASVGVRYHF